MPELPEVEAARRAIEEHCVGKKIVRAIIADDSKVIDGGGGITPADFQASLVGKTILSAHRKGKNMWIRLDSPPFPSFQFGMSGAIHIKGVAVTKYKRSIVKDSDEWPSKYSKFFVELDDGLELSFTDPRRFAKVRLLQDPASVPPISELGPDALLEPMDIDDFGKLLSKKKIGIKALLLDQKFISGIGNWIADEVLYQARIHPQQIASTLSKENCETLLQCIKEVIETAIKVEADSSQYPDKWIFHFREKKPGKAFVDGKKIEFIQAGGRTTAFVPALQKLTGSQATTSKEKPSKRMSKKSGNEEEEDNDDSNLEIEMENNEAAKSKKKQNLKREAKKAGAKRKSNETKEENSGDEDEKPVKKSTKKRGRPTVKKGGGAAKRKSKESEDDADEDESSGGDAGSESEENNGVDEEDRKAITRRTSTSSKEKKGSIKTKTSRGVGRRGATGQMSS